MSLDFVSWDFVITAAAGEAEHSYLHSTKKYK
jgi:hypothetical protein